MSGLGLVVLAVLIISCTVMCVCLAILLVLMVVDDLRRSDVSARHIKVKKARRG